MMHSSKGHPKAYVRPATSSEHQAVHRVLTRAFAKDPALNWFGGVRELVSDIDSPTPQDERSMRNLRWFQDSLVRMINIVKGVVAVVVVPGAGAYEAASSTTEYANEEVVGVALWLPPGQTLDLGPLTMLRAGLHKVLFGYGICGLKRLTLDFSPVLNHTLEKAFTARGLDWRDSWHLLEMVVDPIHQNKGYATLMVEDGFRRSSPKPVHLEATRAFSRDIYLHYGFEIDNVHQYGVGEVDANGVRAKGVAATGFPEWVMTKWTV